MNKDELKPYTRKEKILKEIITGETSNIKPYTREEKILQYAAENGFGSGGGNSDIISEYLNNKKQRYLTQSEYDSLPENEKSTKDIVYFITDYKGGSTAGVVAEPTLRKRMWLGLGSCDYQTGSEVTDDKKARSDFIEAKVEDGTIDFNYNGLWGIARCYDSSKQFIGTANATGGSLTGVGKPLEAGGLHDYGTYTLLANTAYVRLVLALDGSAKTATNNNNVSGYDIKFGDTVYNTVSY